MAYNDMHLPFLIGILKFIYHMQAGFVCASLLLAYVLWVLLYPIAFSCAWLNLYEMLVCGKWKHTRKLLALDKLECFIFYTSMMESGQHSVLLVPWSMMCVLAVRVYHQWTDVHPQLGVSHKFGRFLACIVQQTTSARPDLVHSFKGALMFPVHGSGQISTCWTYVQMSRSGHAPCIPIECARTVVLNILIGELTTKCNHIKKKST